jgi:hypothetical protein
VRGRGWSVQHRDRLHLPLDKLAGHDLYDEHHTDHCSRAPTRAGI